MNSELIAAAEAAMAKGSKSFRFASRILSSEKRAAAYLLYSWCRYCDDQIDDAASSEAALKNLTALREQTQMCFNNTPSSVWEFEALRVVANHYKIPSRYFFELLDGMEMDVQGKRYASTAELLLYCYCVAGTVGLMMSHILGVKSDRAFDHACKLGIAMQLTNIARDVGEDAIRGRCYIPAEMRAPRPDVTFESVENILKLAETYYHEGNAGLRYLDVRSALAIATASSVYREIGMVVKRLRDASFQVRAVVTHTRKLYCVVKAFFKVFQSRLQTF